MFLHFRHGSEMDMSQSLSYAHTEAILLAIVIRHQYSSALFLLEHEDAILQNLQPLKEVDNAAKIKNDYNKKIY